MEAAAEPTEAFEWMLVEVFGHRTHWGRGIEVERFGAKMLRIDVPAVEWTTPTEEAPQPQPRVTGWVSHFYGGAAIFSHTLTDEATVLQRNAPYSRPGRFLPPPATDLDLDPDDDEIGEPDEQEEF